MMVNWIPDAIFRMRRLFTPLWNDALRNLREQHICNGNRKNNQTNRGDEYAGELCIETPCPNTTVAAK